MLGGFNVELEQCKWAIVDSLGFIAKDDPATCHHNFDQPRRRWFPRFCTARIIICMGIYRTLHPRRILHAPGDISAHCGFSPDEAEPGPFCLELRTLPTGQQRPPNWPYSYNPTLWFCKNAIDFHRNIKTCLLIYSNRKTKMLKIKYLYIFKYIATNFLCNE